MSPNREIIGATIDDDEDLLALEQVLAEADANAEATKKVVTEAPIKKQLAPPRPRIQEDSTFTDAFSYTVELPAANLRELSTLSSKEEEMDSSDDEEVKNFLERKYNEYGCDINKSLKQKQTSKHESKVAREVEAELKNPTESATPSCSIKNPHNPIKRQSLMSNSFLKAAAPQVRNIPVAPISSTPASSIYTDPVFGLRLINPLVSSALLVERMAGRKSVPFSGVAFHTQRGDLAKDWVIAGALVHKGPVRMSKKDQPYSVWRLSDLRGQIQMVSLFLFGGAHKELWKTAQGMCLAVLNPSVFEKRAESGDVACLSIDTAQKVMVLGQSKDLGVCKARKRNGEPCTATVNLGDCDFCIFHVKQEFSNASSRRSELQSANAGRGMNELRNKILGKSEVFYGGQSFSAVPAKKSHKLVAKDGQRMSVLSEYAVSPFSASVNHASKPKTAAAAIPYAAREGPISKLACNVESSVKQRVKDLERLKALQVENERHAAAAAVAAQSQPSPPSPATPKAKAAAQPATPKTTATKTRAPQAGGTALSSPSPHHSSPSPFHSSPSTSQASPSTSFSAVPDKFKNRNFSPQLSRDNFSLEVTNVSARQSAFAKLKAAKILEKRPIEKVNPNSVRGSRDGKRRAIDDLNEKYSTGAKRQRLETEQRETERKSRIQRIIDASSSHTNLVDMREMEEQDKYFSKLEKKEALEEKMLSTFKMPCKAVICQQCKYTAFSAAERCKTERHPLKVVDAEKRFFQCKDCGNRTATVFKLPKTSCSQCKGSNWLRAAMIRERKVCDGSQGLSIRGDEETFIGSSATANLNLLVPDE